MIIKLQRLLRRVPLDDPGRLIEDWAHGRNWVFKRVHEAKGYVAEGQVDGHDMRLEWGAPQRNYISGRELRLRCEIGLPESLQMLIISRGLSERLEDDAYARLTDGKQTEVKLDLPEETRWLTLYDSTGLDGVPMLGSRLVGVSNVEAQTRRWLEGELGLRLLRACTGWLDADRPFVLMTLRGRLYLRTQVLGADDGLGVQLLDSVVAIADSACARALHLAGVKRPHKSGSSH
jgi:hypothetical protein